MTLARGSEAVIMQDGEGRQKVSSKAPLGFMLIRVAADPVQSTLTQAATALPAPADISNRSRHRRCFMRHKRAGVVWDDEVSRTSTASAHDGNTTGHRLQCSDAKPLLGRGNDKQIPVLDDSGQILKRKMRMTNDAIAEATVLDRTVDGCRNMGLARELELHRMALLRKQVHRIQQKVELFARIGVAAGKAKAPWGRAGRIRPKARFRWSIEDAGRREASKALEATRCGVTDSEQPPLRGSENVPLHPAQHRRINHLIQKAPGEWKTVDPIAPITLPVAADPGEEGNPSLEEAMRTERIAGDCKMQIRGTDQALPMGAR